MKEEFEDYEAMDGMPGNENFGAEDFEFDPRASFNKIRPALSAFNKSEKTKRRRRVYFYGFAGAILCMGLLIPVVSFWQRQPGNSIQVATTVDSVNKADDKLKGAGDTITRPELIIQPAAGADSDRNEIASKSGTLPETGIVKNGAAGKKMNLVRPGRLAAPLINNQPVPDRDSGRNTVVTPHDIAAIRWPANAGNELQAVAPARQKLRVLHLNEPGDQRSRLPGKIAETKESVIININATAMLSRPGGKLDF